MIVADLRGDREIGTEKGRSELGDEFFLRIAFVAEPHAPKIPHQALLVLRPVREFMRQRGGVALGIAEGLEGRHLHIIGAFGVVGARAAVTNDGAGRGKEPVGRIDALEVG